MSTRNSGSDPDHELIEAASTGDVRAITDLLERHPEKLHLRIPPYDWTLLHLAAQHGHLPVVDLLLARGLDVNTREKGDNTYAMHWAAANGHLDVVRRLAEAGGDVIGEGDDHGMAVIGWAGFADPSKRRDIAEFLISRGARHHIFSAIAMDDDDTLRRIVASDPSALERRMSHNESHQPPLHFAVQRKCARIVRTLIELGADPLAVDDFGFAAWSHATDMETDRPILEKIQGREPFASLALHDWPAVKSIPSGVLHLMAKRGDVEAVRWLLEHAADPNARWAHWDSELTPLHLAVLGGHADVAQALIEAGADPHVRDTKHDSSAIGWAEFFNRDDLVAILMKRDGSP